MKELCEMELKEVDGGIVWWAPIVIGVVLAGIVTDWPGFKQGIADAFRE